MRLTRILFLMLLLSLAVFGQTNRGGISGTVTDAAGAAIPGAKVTVTNLGTNQSITINTSDDGAFSATSLEPVKYSVTVEAANFKTSVMPEVKVDTATTQTVNIVLDAGNISEKVTITADVPLINTESGTTGKTITERQLEDVPLTNRSVLDLATTVPNVSGDVGSEDPDVTSGVPAPGYNLSINGGRPGSTSILADGTNNTGVGIARQVVSFTPETVQEFTVQTSAYSAEYGNTAGGVINATTKSGTNRFTGTALWYHRNPGTNAKKWSNALNAPPNNVRTNQVSFSIGGPVFLPGFGEGGSPIYNGKDRTFFFVAVEPRWRKDFLVVDTLLPTAAERAGDFRGLVRTASGFVPASVAAQFGLVSTGSTNIFRQYVLVGNQLQRLANPGTGLRYCQFGETTTVAGSQYCSSSVTPSDALNVIPQNFLDPIALEALNFMPVPTGYYRNASGGVSNYQVSRFVVQNEVRYTGRFDHNFTSNNRASLRYTVVPAIGEKGFGSEINGNGASYSNSKQFVFSDNHIFSSSIINELRLGYTTGTFSDDFTKEFSIIGGRNLSTELGLPSITEGGMPLFQLGSSDNTVNAFANIGSSGSTNNFNKEKRYTLTDIVYWNQGNKTWKFGFDYSDAHLNVIPFFAASGGRYDFRQNNTGINQTNAAANGGNGLASYLIGVANAVAVRPLLIPYNYNWKSYAGFVQNDWKVKPNFTLNLGFRYSLYLPRTEENNLQGVFMPELSQTFALPTPVTLPTGRVVTTALVPPFAFSGRGGRSRYLTEIDWSGYEPRFGFAWSPKSLFGWGREGETVIRGGYGLSHAPLTGNNRLPLPDLGAFNVNAATTTATGSTGSQNTAFALRLSSNQPVNGFSLTDATPAQIEQVLGIPADGLVYMGSLAIPAYAIPGKTRTPNVQNWNLSLSKQIMRNTVLEVAYVGSKGTHLLMPMVNINPRDFDYIQQLDLLGAATETAVNDPLGRRSLIGTALTVPTASLGSKYLGFDTLNDFYNTSANSVRHAAYIDIRRRITDGLAFTANYTYGKSMDDASDASPDKNILTSGNTPGANVSFGAPRSSDRAVSAFDVKHAFSSTFIWDLPFGSKRRFLSDTWGPLDAIVGGWTMSGVFKMMGGYPFLPTIADGNTIGTLTHTVRPDLVLGVPLVNPRWDPNCKASSLCEPYVNPAAFMRPAKGELGSAPRTMEIRGPMQKTFDVSFQKNFKMPFGWDDEGRRRFQFRVDLINAFNMPVFRVSSPTSGGGPDFMGAPVETAITAAEYDNWVAFDPANRPARTTTAGAAAFAQAVAQRPTGVLPLNFYTIQLPEGFATTNPNAFDITNQTGYKLYRLKNAYGANGSTWGQLRELGNPRYIQFGLKLFF
jgi:hypothetical protein